jgi:catechol 2,3-dioxygenase-like lactoylglutathione lyase family enzyme
MIHGAHVLLYSRDAEADRAFFRDVLGFPAVDAGRGWLIFALPPAELAVHPADDDGAAQPPAGAEVYLMCTDLAADTAALRARGVQCSAPSVAAWGASVTLRLPGGGRLGLYQPSHPTAIGRRAKER